MRLDMDSAILAVSSPTGPIQFPGNGKPYYRRSLAASLMARNTRCSCVSKMYSTRICNTDYLVHPIQDIPGARIKRIAKSVDLKAVSRKRIVTSKMVPYTDFSAYFVPVAGFQHPSGASCRDTKMVKRIDTHKIRRD